MPDRAARLTTGSEPMLTAEEQRAADYRAREARRALALAARVKDLAGSDANRKALAERWLPVELAQKEK